MKKYLLASAAALLLTTIAAQASSGFALVNFGGALINGVNVANVKHVTTGEYIVQFADDVSQCAISGTVSGRVLNPFPGQIVVTTRNLYPNDVRVTTFANNSNQPADYKFYLLAQCF